MALTTIKQLLTKDVYDALVGANAPSSSNVYATIADLGSLDNIYTADGSLTGNRSLNGATFTLGLTNLDGFTVGVNVGLISITGAGSTTIGGNAGVTLTSSGNSVTVNANSLTLADTGTVQQQLVFSDLGGTAFNGILQNPDLTAARTWTFQDASGTIAHLTDIDNIYNTSASLTAARTLTNAGFNLTFAGSGSRDTTFTSEGNVGMGIVPSSNVHLRIRGKDTLNATKALVIEGSSGVVAYQITNSGRTGINVPVGQTPLALLDIRGGVQNNNSLRVSENTVGANPRAIYTRNNRDNGIAILAETDLTAGRSNSFAVDGRSRGVGIPIRAFTRPAPGSNVEQLRLQADTDGLGAQVGGFFTAYIQNDASAVVESMRQAYQFTDDTAGAENVSWTLGLIDGGTANTEKIYIDETAIRFSNLAGVGTEHVTVDAAGNLGRGAAGVTDNIYNADGSIPAATTRTVTIADDSVLTFTAPTFGTILSLDGATGKVTIPGLLDPTGLQMTVVAANPGDANTLWANSTDTNRPYWGAASKLAFITDTLYGGDGTITSGRIATLGGTYRWSGNGSFGMDIAPSATYKWQMENTTHDYSARFRHSKDAAGSIVYAQSSTARAGATQLIGIHSEITSVTTSGKNVAGYFTASGALGAFNNIALLVPNLQGQVVFGSTIASNSGALVTIKGKDNLAATRLIDARNFSNQEAFYVRADKFVSVNAAAKVGAESFAVTGFARISGTIGVNGATSNTAAAINVPNNTGMIGVPGVVVLRQDATQGIILQSATIGKITFDILNNQRFCIMDGIAANLNSTTFIGRTTTGGDPINEAEVNITSKYFNVTDLEAQSKLLTNVTDAVADEFQLDVTIGGTVKGSFQSTGSNFLVAGDIETTGSTNGYIVEDRTNGNRYRVYTDGGVLNTELA